MPATSVSNWWLRPIAPADAKLAFAITKAAIGPHVARVYGEWNEDLQRSNFAISLQQLPYQIVIMGNTPVGLLAVQAGQTIHYLRTIYLLPQVQNSGLGTTVMRHVMARAAVRGVPLKLRVFHLNPARKLYERLGFQTAEIVDDIRRVMVWHPHGA